MNSDQGASDVYVMSICSTVRCPKHGSKGPGSFNRIQKKLNFGQYFLTNQINNIFSFPYSHQTSTLRITDKYPLEPPEVPPRDYTTDEDHHLDNGKN